MSEHGQVLQLLTHIINQNGYIARQQEKQMATLADLQASVATAKTAVDALVAKVTTPGAPSVPESELDAVKTEIDALATEANNAVNPPAA